MIALLRRRRTLTRSAAQMRQRAREVGVGLPDISAPSAHHEVELSEELIAAADTLYLELDAERKDRPDREAGNDGGPAQHVGVEEAAELADAENRELITLNV